MSKLLDIVPALLLCILLTTSVSTSHEDSGTGTKSTAPRWCNDTMSCDAYCSNLTAFPWDIDVELGREDGVEFIKYCIENAFSSETTTINCSVFIPLATPLSFCSASENQWTCGLICSIRHPKFVPNECKETLGMFCRVYILSSAPMDTIAEELLTFSINNYMDSLELDEITDRISSVLSSATMRGGKLSERGAQEVFSNFDGLFESDFEPHWRRSTSGTAQDVFEKFDGALSQIGQELKSGARNETFFYSGNNLIANVEHHRPPMHMPKNAKIKFPTDEVIENGSAVAVKASVEIPYAALCYDVDDANCSVVVAVSIISNFTEYLQESIQNNSNTSDSSLEFPDAVLLSVDVFDSENLVEGLKEYPVELCFMPLDTLVEDINGSEYEYQGVFLDTTTFNWSSEGISNTTLDFVNGTIKVSSTHLTSFSVLVSVSNPESNDTQADNEETALTVVTYIGCGVSIICLVIIIIALVTLRKKLKKGVLLYIHLNLSIALLLALIVFVAGLETATINSVLCTIVAALIQYLFLCALCWMLCEGIMLYLLVVRVFGNLAKKWYLLLILGWGVPFPIVVLSAALLHGQYGTQDYCWIEVDGSNVAIWTFVVPMIIIMVINAMILVMTVVAILRGRKCGGAESDITTSKLACTAVKGCVVLLPLLGLTWVFGLFAVNSNTTVFAWLFTICNSFQGLFILVFHVLRNEKVLRLARSSFSRVQQAFTAATFSGDTLTKTNSPDTKSPSADIIIIQKELSASHSL